MTRACHLEKSLQSSTATNTYHASLAMLALVGLSVSFATPMLAPMIAPRAAAPVMNGAFLALDAVAPAVESYVSCCKRSSALMPALDPQH